MPKPTYAGSITGAGAQVVPPIFTNATSPKGSVNTTASGKSTKSVSDKAGR